MNLAMMLFMMGMLGFVLNSSNMILMLMSMEMMLLSMTLIMMMSSFTMDDIVGQTFGMYVMSVAGAESAMGLSILVAYYSLSGTIAMENK